ncbi:MAG: Arc family DNA-binding protein [Proteobacteria bacterium]|nr:Arc family DNA-binding protein [Pseudomonadota bacterium]
MNRNLQPTPYPLRMSESLRAFMMNSAGKNGRSLNGELIFRLEESRKRELGQIK